MNKKDRKIIEWAKQNAYKSCTVAGRRKIRDQFDTTRSRAERLAKIAREEATTGFSKEAPEAGEFQKNEQEMRLNDDGSIRAKLNILKDPDDNLDIEDVTTNPYVLKFCRGVDLDLDDFEIASLTDKCWNTPIKLKKEDGTEECITKTNYYIDVKWVPKKTEPLLEAIKKVEERLMNYEGRPKVAKLDKAYLLGDKMLEVALYDLHFGSMCWRMETGNDYDTKISKTIYEHAIAEIIERTRIYNFEKIVMPIGNDWLHINNPENFTPASKNSLDVDGRLTRVYEMAAMMLIESVDLLTDVAPVELLWIPGNHDPQTSYYLAREVKAYYKDDARVTIDISPKIYKYMQFKNNLLGFAHLDKISKTKEKQLAGWFADEAAEAWEDGQYRELHTGHEHKAGEIMFHGASQYGSVMLRKIPSLCGTDFWHYGKGFAHGPKIAQFFIWGEQALLGADNVFVPPSMYNHAEVS